MSGASSSEPVIVGLDVGGTKAAVIVETLAGTRLVEATLPSADWDAEPVSDGAAWLARAVDTVVPVGRSVAMLGVGAQGLDAPETVSGITGELARLGIPSVCVNDAQLLVPAASLETGFGVISGTGAIAVGRTAAGDPIAAGGWGWVIGDEAGAAGLVRLATIAALDAHEDGRDDVLLDELLSDFGAADAERLARMVNDVPTPDNWAPHAPAVFRAAEAGSAAADRVIAAAALHLRILIDRLVARGAVGDTVVCAGSVIANQPALFDGFVHALAGSHPTFSVVLLDRQPVEGAIVLARRALKA